MSRRFCWTFLLFVLSFFTTAGSVPVCNNKCCRFVENFPARLKTLRQDYSQIRALYETHDDDLNTALLDRSVHESFKSVFACQTINSILGFYLNTVLPTAMAGVNNTIRELKPYVESIQQIFTQLNRDVNNCKHYFSCAKQFDVKLLMTTYTQMERKGPIKAMEELDLLFNFVEMYLASKRRINV